MTNLIREWRREAERKPFDVAAWNRLANVNNGLLAAFTTWVDADGGPLVEADPTAGASKATLAGALAVGAGAATMTGTLSVSGLFAAAAAATVGTTLGVGGKLTAGSAEVTGLFQAATAATVGTTLTVGGALAANGGVVLPNNVALSAKESSGFPRGVVSIDSSNQQLFGAAGGGMAILRGGGVKLQYGAATTVLEIGNNQLTFFGGTSLAGRGNVGSAATDLASCITLANNLRALVRSFNLSS